MRLALCFLGCGEKAEAAAAYTEFIRLSEQRGVHNQYHLSQAYKYLAGYHFESGHSEDVLVAANKCLEFPETREQAKAMLRQIALLTRETEEEEAGEERQQQPLPGHHYQGSVTSYIAPPSKTGSEMAHQGVPPIGVPGQKGQLRDAMEASESSERIECGS
ncbi:unnamed protein product [Protopolystoma xenopodis]|uniref:Uncharacterized protein n=1 Tax=Protopolystoma xenopodis TaxID=117903 RepID=A0A3S4ZWU3_9PLAT|nr:unnamed protein product [Protopolystoma xenopodis]